MAAARPMIRTYLDYNATAPLRPEAREAALAAMETTGNPSSVHAEGRAARRIVEDARSDVARLAGVSVPLRHLRLRRHRGRERGAQSALRRRRGRGAARAAHRLGRRASLRPRRAIGFPARGNGAVAPPTDESISTGSRPPAAVRDARCWRCKARTTRPASSSRSPKRRRWSTPRADSCSATRCRLAGRMDCEHRGARR